MLMAIAVLGCLLIGVLTTIQMIIPGLRIILTSVVGLALVIVAAITGPLWFGNFVRWMEADGHSDRAFWVGFVGTGILVGLPVAVRILAALGPSAWGIAGIAGGWALWHYAPGWLLWTPVCLFGAYVLFGIADQVVFGGDSARFNAFKESHGLPKWL
jgi:hypothetical protein